MCYIEVDAPPKELYMALGYDENKLNGNKKHYRKFISEELECCPDYGLMSPFDEFKIKYLVLTNQKG